MSIFTTKESKKPSFFDKILNRTPKENAIIEINNLFVENEDDLTKVNLEHIREIADRYKIKLNKKFKALRFELFRKYVHHCLEDQVIDQDEVNTIQHLKKLLHLTEADIKHVLDFETKKIFDREVRIAVSDGKLTQDEKDKLEMLKKNLLLNDQTAKDILNSNSNKILRDFIDNAISDERLSDEEFEKMNEISQSLGIEPNLDAKTKENLQRYRLYWTIENGELPIYTNPPINIQKSENLYFMGRVNWQEQRRVTKRINYGGPTARIKIAKGVYYRMGSIAAKSVSEDVWKVIDSGNLYLTNKRIIFMGSKGNKTIRLNKVLDITPYKNGVDIQKDTGKSPFLEFSTNVDIFSMMLVRLMDEL
ncbi:hypothetical protein D2V08_13885 [Flagellimonas lutimaris]|uniref:Armadillo-like repeats domain-containing protein n=1 Tax=Flagellimonas lutimaris TaxID=475082 RepID=A0A3A1N4A9_9FLAO|nr:hypothetical protein [Allomuricauda lutimaris]RIV31532.1 hypothetical protein D2V08_13885 [Allomuricauda lutimaris]